MQVRTAFSRTLTLHVSLKSRKHPLQIFRQRPLCRYFKKLFLVGSLGHVGLYDEICLYMPRLSAFPGRKRNPQTCLLPSCRLIAAYCFHAWYVPLNRLQSLFSLFHTASCCLYSQVFYLALSLLSLLTKKSRQVQCDQLWDRLCRAGQWFFRWIS